VRGHPPHQVIGNTRIKRIVAAGDHVDTPLFAHFFQTPQIEGFVLRPLFNKTIYPSGIPYFLFGRDAMSFLPEMMPPVGTLRAGLFLPGNPSDEAESIFQEKKRLIETIPISRSGGRRSTDCCLSAS